MAQLFAIQIFIRALNLLLYVSNNVDTLAHPDLTEHIEEARVWSSETQCQEWLAQHRLLHPVLFYGVVKLHLKPKLPKLSQVPDK